MINKNKIVVAIDGISASGKGSVAKLLAKEFNLDYLDTGLLYRAVGYYMLEKNLTTNNLDKLINIAENLDLSGLSSLNLQDEKFAKAASIVAKIPEIRKALFSKQVNFANNPDSKKCGAILDGRDIGTIICPKADIKFFFTASLDVRAKRRYEQLKLSNLQVNLSDIQNAIKARDTSDKQINDLAINSKEYIIIDNSNLTLSETFELCKKYVRHYMYSKK